MLYLFCVGALLQNLSLKTDKYKFPEPPKKPLGLPVKRNMWPCAHNHLDIFISDLPSCWCWGMLQSHIFYCLFLNVWWQNVLTHFNVFAKHHWYRWISKVALIVCLDVKLFFFSWPKFSCLFKTLANFFQKNLQQPLLSFLYGFIPRWKFPQDLSIQGCRIFFCLLIVSSLFWAWQRFSYGVDREHYSHFTREETLSWRGEGACLITIVMRWQSAHLNLCLFDCDAVLIVSLLCC